MDPLSIAMLVAGIAGSAATVGGNIYMNRRNNEFNSKMSDPSFMMQRMVAAGINPNAAAQGISGAAPQGSATTFNGMPNISDSLLNALREGSLTPSEKRNIDADTNVKEGEAEGLGIDNKQKLATFDDNVAILKQNRRMNDYQIEQLRPYAEHADEWYKVNFDNLDEKVKEIRENIRKIDEEIRKIEKEENLIDAQTGEVQSETRKNDSITALNRQKKELIDSLGGEDVESAYVIACVEGDDRRADAIKEGVKDYVEAESKGAYNGDPVHREFNNTQDARDKLTTAINDAIEAQKQLGIAFANGRITQSAYLEADKEYTRLIKELQNSKKSVDRAFSAQSYKNGYHTWWQDNATSLINSAAHLGSAAIISGGIKSKPSNPIGFRR